MSSVCQDFEGTQPTLREGTPETLRENTQELLSMIPNILCTEQTLRRKSRQGTRVHQIFVNFSLSLRA